MATEIITLSAIEWFSLDGGSTNLGAMVKCDFDIYREYNVNAHGAFAQAGMRHAAGAVFDNLENPLFVLIDINGFNERVAPYSKSAVMFVGNQPRFKARSNGGQVHVNLFTALFPGAAYGINPLGARDA